ncbi:MAG TPA: DUF2905 domain-containing protein [Candidatus Angelobacter sp.]
MVELGKLLLLLGGIIVVIGLALLFAGRLHLPLGHLPGDFVYRGKNTVVYFPLGTSILVSIILSLLSWLVSRGRR